jgi:hypothetical protein
MRQVPALKTLLLTVGSLCVTATLGFAQTDEIQVYDGGLAAPGKANLTWHQNFTPDGLKTPAFENGLVPNKLYVGVSEWAAGVTEWLEAGLYFPLYSANSRGAAVNGFKLRALFAAPHAATRRFFYGANFEFSVNARRWDEHRITSEVRPIVGWHLKPVDIVLNPIVDTSYDGVKNLDFAPAWRIAVNLPRSWAVAVEEYADYGPLRHFYSASEQAHQLFAVVNRSTKFGDVEAGIGLGLTNATDKLALKLLFSRDLN